MMTLASLAPLLNARLLGADKPVLGISTDSRTLQKQDLFVALRGERFDGHLFIEQAIANGAGAVIVDAEQPGLSVPQLIVADTCLALGQVAAHKRTFFKGAVIAITGSSGKTSVKGMLREILSVAYEVAVTPGNFNNHIGVPLSLMRLDQQSYGVIEVGTSHPGEIAYLTNLVMPDIAVVNNVMPAHIGGFGSLEAIAFEKSAIYSTLTEHQCAIINIDDQFRKVFEDQTRHCRHLGFSVTNNASDYPVLRAQNIVFNRDFGVAFDLVLDQQAIAVNLNVPGLHSVKNALAAASCAFAAGCSFEQIAEGLERYRGEAGRMQRKPGLHDACVIDDTYNANPGSVKAAVDYLSSCAGKRILVLGDLGELGDIAAQTHQELGAYARQKQLDAVYACGQFAQRTVDGFGQRGVAFETKQTMIDVLKQVLDNSTTVLVKGSRSARMEEVVRAISQDEGKTPC